MLMMLPQLRDRVSFCLIKDTEELGNLRKISNKNEQRLLCKTEFNIGRLLTVEKEGSNRTYPRRIKILNDMEEEGTIQFLPIQELGSSRRKPKQHI